MKFLSDNTAPATPEVFAALQAANRGAARAYGDDDWSRRLDAAFSDYFERPVRAFPVSTGTAANALALATLTPPYGAIYATDAAHVVHDECGAVELQSGGARITTLPSPDGRLDAGTLERALADTVVSVHSPQPAAVTITQVTECGTVYRPDQVAALAAVAHAKGLALHMDGARFANALAALGQSPATLTWRAGVDVLSFGATKNGAINAEAVVFFDTDLVRDFELRRKRAAQLLSKMRYASAQLLACLEGSFFAANAARANRLAARIAMAAAPRLLFPVEANLLFLKLSADEAASLRSKGFEFYNWGPPRDSGTRFAVSWDQPEADVDALCGALCAWS
jgi:threonine aldolase